MLEKDYIMRIIQAFMEAVGRITKSINDNDLSKARIHIDETYDLVGNSSGFFLEKDTPDIVDFLKSKEDDYLKRVSMLAELMQLDATVENKQGKELELLKKSKLLYEHYIASSKDFSIDINNKLAKVNSRLKELEGDS